MFFFGRQRLGGGGFHRKSRNIAIRQFNALKSWPYTSKFTYDHPEQIETIFKSIGGFGKFWGAVERVRFFSLQIALKSWPYTSKFTYDHPEQSEASVNIGGPWNALDQKIQILSGFRFSDFWSNFRFSYFFSKSP